MRKANPARRRLELARAERAYERAERKHQQLRLGAWDLFLAQIRLDCARQAVREVKA